eukprot:6177009-Pleurochrysis_carterae.AAC.1
MKTRGAAVRQAQEGIESTSDPVCLLDDYVLTVTSDPVCLLDDYALTVTSDPVCLLDDYALTVTSDPVCLLDQYVLTITSDSVCLRRCFDISAAIGHWRCITFRCVDEEQSCSSEDVEMKARERKQVKWADVMKDRGKGYAGRWYAWRSEWDRFRQELRSDVDMKTNG